MSASNPILTIIVAILCQAIMAKMIKMAKIDVFGWPDVATNMVRNDL